MLCYFHNGNNSNNALNGFYYPIDRIIVYDSHVRDYVLNDRLRFDLTDYMIESGANGFVIPTAHWISIMCLTDICVRFIRLPKTVERNSLVIVEKLCKIIVKSHFKNIMILWI